MNTASLSSLGGNTPVFSRDLCTRHLPLTGSLVFIPLVFAHSIVKSFSSLCLFVRSFISVSVGCSFGYLFVCRSGEVCNNRCFHSQDVQYGDIDYMIRQLDFTYDPVAYDGLPDFVRSIKKDGLRYIIILVTTIRL